MNGISAFGLFVAGGVALVSPSCSFTVPPTNAVDSSCEHFYLNSELERHHELFTQWGNDCFNLADDPSIL
jgi:hypothetical protein